MSSGPGRFALLPGGKAPRRREKDPLEALLARVRQRSGYGHFDEHGRLIASSILGRSALRTLYTIPSQDADLWACGVVLEARCDARSARGSQCRVHPDEHALEFGAKIHIGADPDDPEASLWWVGGDGNR